MTVVEHEYASSEAVEALLNALGVEVTPTNAEQMGVFIYAFLIMVERNYRYKDLWKEYGWKGTVMHVMSKARRVQRMFWENEPERDEPLDLDDLYDLINYSAFTIRNMADNNKTGS